MSAAQHDELDFGRWHDDHESVHPVWRPATGALVAHALTGPRAGQATRLRWLPASGHPHPRRAALIAEAALAGWPQHSGRPDSRAWLHRRLSALEGARLAPIDWTVACPSPGCPRHAEPIGSHSPDWAETCDRCLAPRLVVVHGLVASQLEAQLRGGAWQLATRRRA